MHFSMLHGRAPIVDLLLQKVRRARPTAHSIDSSDDSLSAVIQKTEACASVLCSGGDDGDRTHDLRLAKPALSQLSYVPVITAPAATAGAAIVKDGGPDKARTCDLPVISRTL